MLKHTISFQNALRGIWTAIITQANIRIHFIIGAIVIISAVYLELSIYQVLILVLAILAVMVTEMLNTAVEFLANAITLEHNVYIKHAKDVSAGAVLMATIFAILIGIIIFVPQIMNFL